MTRRKLSSVVGILALLTAACGAGAAPTATAPPAAALAPTAGPAPTTAPRATPLPGASPTATPRPGATPTAAPTGPKTGGTVRNVQRGDPTPWDHLSFPSGLEQLSVVRTAVFTPLLAQWSDKPDQCQWEVYPVGLKSWRWVDNSMAEFTLREGIKFENRPPVNGREATTEDVAAFFERYLEWGVIKVFAPMVESLTVKDKYTFQVKLKQPWGGFIVEMMAFGENGPWLEPKELAGLTAEERARPETSWIGSGPFKFHSYAPAVKTKIVRNPEFWGKGRPYLDAVEYYNMPDASTRQAALFSGQINLIRDAGEEAIALYEARVRGLQTVRCTGTHRRDVGGMWMNVTGPPFNDVRVRRAAVMTIDQQAIIDTFYLGKGAPTAVFPAGMQYAMALKDFPPEVRQYMEYNPPRAKQLLAEAGYPNGLDTVINFTSRYAAPSPQIVEALADMLGKVGIRAKIQMHEYARYVALVLNHTPPYPVGEMAVGLVAARTPEGTMGYPAYYGKAGSGNRGQVKDPEYDKLFEEFRISADEARRTELARQMQILAADKAYGVRLPFVDSTMTALPGLHFKWIGNTSAWGMMLEHAWFDQPASSR